MAQVEKQPPEQQPKPKLPPLQLTPKDEITLAPDAIPEPMASGKQAEKTEESPAQKLRREFAQGLSGEQGGLVKAVVTGDANYVLKPQKEAKPTPDDIRKFVEIALERPGVISTEEGKITGQITRGTDDHPDDWAWKGPRARYRIAAANLNKKVNDTFGTKIPVTKYLLSEEALMEHYKQKQTPPA